MKRILTMSLVAMTSIGIVCVATPMLLMYPFKAQTPARLAIGHAVVTWSAGLTLVLLVLGVVAASFLWRRLGSWWGRALAGVALVTLTGCAFFGRRSAFEVMFHPLLNPVFVTAGESKDVADEDLVLGVAIGDQARAYPVRAMGYHHLVNDVVAGEPIVATY